MGMSDRKLGQREFWPIWDGYLVSLNGSRLLLIHNHEYFKRIGRKLLNN